MPRVSRSRLQNRQLEEITEHFSYLISSLTKRTDIETFLNEFLTKEEKIMLAKRLTLFMMLEKQYAPPGIKSVLKVSYETVRSYKQQLSFKSTEFRKII